MQTISKAKRLSRSRDKEQNWKNCF